MYAILLHVCFKILNFFRGRMTEEEVQKYVLMYVIHIHFI